MQAPWTVLKVPRIRRRAPTHIDQVFAFMATDSDQQEGIQAMAHLNGQPVPMVCASMERAGMLRSVAQRLANESGHEVTLSRFANRTDLEVYEPQLGA